MSEIDTSDEAVERLAFYAEFHDRPQTAAALRALRDERNRLRAAWLRVIQAENACVVTGTPCSARRCGCWGEQELLIAEMPHD